MPEEKSKAEAQETEVSTVDQLVSYLDTEDKKDAVAEFIKQLGEDYKVERINAAMVSQYIEKIDKALSEQMD